MTKHELILQLQRMIQDLEHGNVEATCKDVVAELYDRLIFDRLQDEGKVGLGDDINKVECDSIIDALEALCEVGVVNVQVHPAFWSEWHTMFRRRQRSISPDQKLLSVSVEINEEIDQGRFYTIIGEMPCHKPNCPNHGVLYRQWRHRLPENAMAPLPNLDPKLN